MLQVLDSETVLSMINKTSTRFKVYEGVRIGEIQAATDGDVLLGVDVRSSQPHRLVDSRTYP